MPKLVVSAFIVTVLEGGSVRSLPELRRALTAADKPIALSVGIDQTLSVNVYLKFRESVSVRNPRVDEILSEFVCVAIPWDC